MYKIEKGHPNFKDLQFVLSARSKDSAKPVFQCVMIEKEFINNEPEITVFYGTDSRRLHFTQFKSNIPSGVYSIVKAKDFIGFELSDNIFPNVSRIIPDIKNLISIGILKKQDKYNFAISTAAHKISIALQTAYLNHDFINDIAVDEFDIYTIAPDKPVVFKNCSKTALVMPIRASI